MDEQGAQIAVAAFAHPEQQVATRARMLARHQPEPCGQFPAAAKLTALPTAGIKAVAANAPTASTRPSRCAAPIRAEDWLDASLVVSAALERAKRSTISPRHYHAFAVLDIVDGGVISQCKPRHRHQEFLSFLNHLDRNVPAALEVHLIADNYATHKHP
jgi:hypothetical protein